MSFARKFGDKYGKKLMDIATKTGIDPAKTARKRVVQKKKRKKQTKQKKFTFHQKKDNKLLMTWDCFEHKMSYHCIKMEFQEVANFIDSTFDDKE